MNDEREIALQERLNDRDYWAKLHVRSDRSKAISLNLLGVKRCVARGGGTRRERGGHKFEEKE